jgi:hypothetical protein
MRRQQLSVRPVDPPELPHSRTLNGARGTF